MEERAGSAQQFQRLEDWALENQGLAAEKGGLAGVLQALSQLPEAFEKMSRRGGGGIGS